MEITLNNIGKKFEGNSNYTLESVNLKINSGEFIVLLGPSGSGKTTLLRMIAGLIPITKGDLFFGNKRVNNVLPKERDIAMVFQSYALYPTMDVYNNIAFSLKMKKVSKEIIHKKVIDIAAVLDISHILYKKPSEISGGQRQRVALGRAMIRKPAIFLMDEPLSNLDAKLRNIMRAEIKRMHKMLNTTSLYVTHDQYEAMALADRIVLINNNEIQQVGTPDEVYFKPANLWVAKFVGNPEMAFFDGVITKGKFVSTDSKVKLKVDTKFEGEVVIGCRPEEFEITTKANSNLTGSVLDIQKLGNIVETQVYLDDKKFVTIISNRSKKIMAENEVVSLAMNKINIFDKKSGVRINE